MRICPTCRQPRGYPPNIEQTVVAVIRCGGVLSIDELAGYLRITKVQANVRLSRAVQTGLLVRAARGVYRTHDVVGAMARHS